MKAEVLPAFARHHRAVCLAEGLFCSLEKGARKREKLDVAYRTATGSWRFRGPDLLGIDDLKHLQAIVALSGREDRKLSADPKTSAGVALRHGLELSGHAANRDAMMFLGSYRQIAAAAGYNPDAGGSFKRTRASLERMTEITVWVEMASKTGKGTQRGSYRLISSTFTDEGNGAIAVAVNPDIAAAILGDTPWCRLDMEEMRQLTSDAAVKLHQQLSAVIDQGKQLKIGMDTLVAYVWPSPAGNAATRKRKERLRKAIAEIAAGGWVFDAEGDVFTISRPRKKREAA